ncbi:hypothetical protein SCUP234_02037 [Seiridium cupressi]
MPAKSRGLLLCSDALQKLRPQLPEADSASSPTPHLPHDALDEQHSRLTDILPGEGMLWHHWGSGKEFLSNAQARKITKEFRSHLPNLNYGSILYGVTRMIKLVEANVDLCEHFMLPRHFFEHIKNEIAWMSILDGETLAAFFRAVLHARTRITTAAEYLVEVGRPVPEYMRDSSILTVAVDEMMCAFKTKYTCGYWQLHINYGFAAARSSDSEPEKKRGDKRVKSAQGATNNDGSSTTEPDNKQDADGDTAMVEASEPDVPEVEASTPATPLVQANELESAIDVFDNIVLAHRPKQAN